MKTLIVEHHPSERARLAAVARSCGHDVTEAGNAEDAWRAYRREGHSLILLDWALPDGKAGQFCRDVRALPDGTGTMVLAVAVRDQAGGSSAAIEAGADGFVVRPIKADLLRALQVIAETAEDRTPERVAAEEVLLDSQKLAASILNSIGQGLLVIDQDFTIRAINDSLSHTLGRSPEQSVGKKCYTVVRGLDSPCDDCPSVRTFQDAGRHRIERIDLRIDGGIRSVSLESCPVVDDDGNVVFLIEIIEDITDRLRMEREILEISTDEQRRIGQDLHDGLGQQLTGIAFLSKGLATKLASRNLPETADAGDIVRLVNEAISQTRALSCGLSPVGLEEDGLVSALRELASTVSDVFNVACLFDCHGIVQIQGGVTATHLYRIAQEAASNAIKHGRAKEIAIALRSGDDRTSLTVRDNGDGFVVSAEGGKGIGLRLMRYRARAIGASLRITSHPGSGTSVECWLPPTDSARE